MNEEYKPDCDFLMVGDDLVTMTYECVNCGRISTVPGDGCPTTVTCLIRKAAPGVKWSVQAIDDKWLVRVKELDGRPDLQRTRKFSDEGRVHNYITILALDEKNKEQ